MERLRFDLVAVANNDFQELQVAAARQTASRLNVDLKVLSIEYDAVTQSQTILSELQAPPSERPHAVIFEPVGTTLAKPAALAASLGIGWAVLGREKVEYIPELRAQYHTPMICVSSSHYEIGCMQGQQLSKLVPHGGTVLYIEGPSTNEAAQKRAEGINATKKKETTLRGMKGLWTETSGYNAVTSFLRVRNSNDTPISAVVAQNDAMALGAYKAFQELTSGEDKKRYLSLPFLGCDGIPNVGQSAVQNGELAATVVIPPNAAIAVEALASALRKSMTPPEQIIADVASFPTLNALKPTAQAFAGSFA